MGNEMLEFKGGSFKAATKGKMPDRAVAAASILSSLDTNSSAAVTVQVSS